VTDRELLDGWRAGDKAAGQEFVARYWPSVARFFRSKIGDDGADLISQTFLACVQATEPIEHASAFLFAVARRRLADHFRQRARTPELDLAKSSLADLGTGPVTAAARRERADILKGALAQIPLDDQIAIELAYFEGLPLRDVAAVLEIDDNTVRSRLARAKAKLRDLVGDEIPEIATEK